MSMTDVIAARAAARATYDSEEEWEAMRTARARRLVEAMRVCPHQPPELVCEVCIAGLILAGPQDPAQRTPQDLPDPVPPIVHPVNPYKDGGSPDPVEIVIPPPSEPKEPRVDTEWPPAPPMPAPKRRK